MSNRPSFPSINIGDAPPPLVCGPLTRTQFVRYAGASHDFNPNHHDEVYAKASRVVDRALMEEFDDYDTLMVVMQTASGKQCHINCCREASYGYDQRFEILGSKGMLMNDNLRASTVRRPRSSRSCRRASRSRSS